MDLYAITNHSLSYSAFQANIFKDINQKIGRPSIDFNVIVEIEDSNLLDKGLLIAWWYQMDYVKIRNLQVDEGDKEFLKNKKVLLVDHMMN